MSKISSTTPANKISSPPLCLPWTPQDVIFPNASLLFLPGSRGFQEFFYKIVAIGAMLQQFSAIFSNFAAIFNNFQQFSAIFNNRHQNFEKILSRLSGHIGIDFEFFWKMGRIENGNLTKMTVSDFDFGQFLIKIWQFVKFWISSNFDFRQILNFVKFWISSNFEYFTKFHKFCSKKLFLSQILWVLGRPADPGHRFFRGVEHIVCVLS